MAKEYSRTQRIGDQMQRELAQLIRREIKDPRVGLVTITAVEVSRDVSHAKIFITVMGQDSAEDIAQNLKVLNDASGFLRMQLGRSMQLRNVPQLHFHFDSSVSRGAHLSALIERAVAEDSQHPDAAAAAAAAAAVAAEADSKVDEAGEAGEAGEADKE